jgi:HTH-type transcriptional regulator, sugar sensing transcriptional regulator
MIVEKKFLNKLKQFGLNSYEAKIWTALLSRGISTAGELSEISNVPRSRSYDVLESLEKKGFIIMKIGKPIKYIAVNPSDVLERVKKNTLDEAQKQAEAVEEIRITNEFQQLDNLFKNGIEMIDPNEMSGSFKSRDHVYSQIESLIKNAEKSIFILTTEEGIIRKVKRFKKHLKKAYERNVKIKILAPLTKKSKQYIDEISDIAEIKIANKINARICIIDEKELTFMLLDDKNVDSSYDAGVWINTEFLAKAMNELFNQAWIEAKEINLKTVMN